MCESMPDTRKGNFLRYELIIVICLEIQLVGFFLLLININNYSQIHDIMLL